MHSIYILHSLAYFGASFAALIVPDHVLRQPFNLSSTATTPGNHTLGDWPPIGAWTPLGGDLSFNFIWYGDYAPRNRWDDIRVAFDKIMDRMKINPNWSTSRWLRFRSGYVSAFFRDDHFKLVPGGVSAVEAVKVVKAIKDFTFVFGYKPREVKVMICEARRETTILTISWETDVSPQEWPTLPFHKNFERSKRGEIYLYGRDAEPSSINGIHETLEWLEGHILTKDTSHLEVKRYRYSNNYLNLRAVGIVSGHTKVRMRRMDLYEIVEMINSLYFSEEYGPRELSIRLMAPHKREVDQWVVIGKVFIYFEDLESTQRAIE